MNNNMENCNCNCHKFEEQAECESCKFARINNEHNV